MRRKRFLVFATASVAAATLLIWALLPYLFPPVYHAVDITIEYRNRLPFTLLTNKANVRALLPYGISLIRTQSTSWTVYFELGLLHVEIEGKSYDAVSLSFDSGVKSPNILTPRSLEANIYNYLFGFFTNNSELGEVLRSYGVPHTYVHATYRSINEERVNRTLLTMTYPNGSLLVDISIMTSGGEVNPLTPWKGYINFCCLRNDNLTVLHLTQEAGLYIYKPLSQGGICQLNMTTSEGSVIWRVLGRIEYALKINLSSFYLLRRMSGKLGWMEWRNL